MLGRAGLGRELAGLEDFAGELNVALNLAQVGWDGLVTRELHDLQPGETVAGCTNDSSKPRQAFVYTNQPYRRLKGNHIVKSSADGGSSAAYFALGVRDGGLVVVELYASSTTWHEMPDRLLRPDRIAHIRVRSIRPLQLDDICAGISNRGEAHRKLNALEADLKDLGKTYGGKGTARGEQPVGATCAEWARVSAVAGLSGELRLARMLARKGTVPLAALILGVTCGGSVTESTATIVNSVRSEVSQLIDK